MRLSPRCIKLPVNRHLDWNEVALSPNISLDQSSMSLDLSLDLSSMSLDLSSTSLDPRVKTIFGRPLFHWTCPAFHLTPVSIVALGWNEKYSLGPTKSFCGKFEKFCVVHVIGLSSMSFNQSSISLDPRVKTIFGRPLFHWTCPAFHLWMTPVSIVALGWNEKFSLGPEKSFCVKFEKFCFIHT
ncbi:hypothetical protein TNCV_2753901 [Trichonephila clavipes]|nr:hypothetical protein TNCV_2753901 [Trichonephila clavipes]